VPDPGTRAAGTYLKLERRVGDFATVGVAVHVSFANGTVSRAGIALTAVGPRNLRATAAEEALAGAELDDEAIREAARLAAEAADPRDDVRGSADVALVPVSIRVAVSSLIAHVASVSPRERPRRPSCSAVSISAASA
jgi:carbon-monoxide dehydrogenase medium subunit